MSLGGENENIPRFLARDVKGVICMFTESLIPELEIRERRIPFMDRKNIRFLDALITNSVFSPEQIEIE